MLILLGIFLLAALEVALRLLPLAPEAADEGDPFVGFSELHPLFVPFMGEDGKMRMRTSPDKLRWFNKQEFSARKQPGTFRIFALGGSTAYGRPFGDATSFSGWMRKLLNNSPGKASVYEVINAGGISYASYRVVNILKELLAYQPDLFVIYTGHNEFLEARTYEDFLAQPALVFKARQQLARLKTYRLLARAYRNIRNNLTEDEPSTGTDHLLSPEVETLLERSAGLELYQRDSLFSQGVFSHFRYNVARMIRLCRDSGVPVLFLTPVDNQKDFSPFKSQNRAELDSRGRMKVARAVVEGNSLVADRRLSEGTQRLREAVAADSVYAETHFYLGRAYLEAGDTAAARSHFFLARELDVCPLRAREQIHLILRNETAAADVEILDLPRIFREGSPGGIIGAEMLLDHIHPIPEGNLLIAREVVSWMDRQGLFEGRLPDKENLDLVYREVVDSLPQSYFRQGAVNLAKVLIWAKKYTEAFLFLDRLWEILAEDAEAQYLMGSALYQLGDIENALAHLQEALRLSPDHLMVLRRLALVYSDLGLTDRAMQTYEKALEIHPEDATLLTNYGFLLRQTGNPGQALELFRRVESLDPDAPELNNNIGLTLLMMGQHGRAIEAFKKALEITPNDAQAWYNLGVTYLMLRRMEDAEEQFREAIRRNPDHAAAHSNLGNIYQNTGRLNQAEEELRLALILDPRLPEPYMNLVLLYRSMGRDSLAVEVARQGLQRFPGDSRFENLTRRGKTD